MTSKRAWLVIVGTVLLPFGGCGSKESAPEIDVVMIVIDTFRPDHLAFNGYQAVTAPFLDDLLERSTVFQHGYSTSSWTAPSTGSIFSGMYPVHHGVEEGFMAHVGRAGSLDALIGERIELNRFSPEIATLPEILNKAGYATIGLSANINIGQEIGFDRGFDEFEKLEGAPASVLADRLLENHRALLDASPYFLYLHFNDPHQPYTPREPWFVDQTDATDRSISAYDSEISYLDSVLGSLYQSLNWKQNTLVVVVSDHGEELGERGRFGHGFSLREVLLRVLVAFHGPDLGIPEQRVDHPTSLIDVLPTILDLVELPAVPDVDGLSMAKLTMAGEAPPKRTLFAHRLERSVDAERELWSAIRFPWKLISRDQETPRLFDLSLPRQQRADVAARETRRARELLAELQAFRESAESERRESGEVELDAQTLERLEVLGYTN